MTTAPPLELHRVTVEHTAGPTVVRALDDLELTVDEGELVALMGPSGSGKTTALDVASGLVAPRSGRVVVAGEEPVEDAPRGVGSGAARSASSTSGSTCCRASTSSTTSPCPSSSIGSACAGPTNGHGRLWPGSARPTSGRDGSISSRVASASGSPSPGRSSGSVVSSSPTNRPRRSTR